MVEQPAFPPPFSPLPCGRSGGSGRFSLSINGRAILPRNNPGALPRQSSGGFHAMPYQFHSPLENSKKYTLENSPTFLNPPKKIEICFQMMFLFSIGVIFLSFTKSRQQFVTSKSISVANPYKPDVPFQCWVIFCLLHKKPVNNLSLPK